MDAEIYKVRANSVHQNRYSYPFETEIIWNREKIEIICPKHGSFFQRPNDHLYNKQGCPTCNGNRKITTQDFIKSAREKHGNKYEYSEYKSLRTKIKINCVEHNHTFEQYPWNHLSNKVGGCKFCRKKDFRERQCLQPQEFIEKAKEIHNNEYCYDNTKFFSTRGKIEVICRKHGSFSLRASHHIYEKQGCPKCSVSVSGKEISWLNSINIPDDSEHRQVKIKINNKRYFVDGFDPTTNTIYEFLGDFWHGNPNVFEKEKYNTILNKTFGYLYEKTFDKIESLKQNGYNVIYIWEADFK